MSTTDNTKSDCGVYTITNSKTLKVYVGSSAKVKRRWADHKRTLLSGEHVNSKLRNSAETKDKISAIVREHRAAKKVM